MRKPKIRVGDKVLYIGDGEIPDSLSHGHVRCVDTYQNAPCVVVDFYHTTGDVDEYIGTPDVLEKILLN